MLATENLLSIPNFAKLKKVPTLRIRNLISLGVIEPEEISGKLFVDKIKYAGLDCEARVKREKSVADLVSDNTLLKQRLKKLENVVYGNVEAFGTSKK